jgi:hypothetical protein
MSNIFYVSFHNLVLTVSTKSSWKTENSKRLLSITQVVYLNVNTPMCFCKEVVVTVFQDCLILNVQCKANRTRQS